jgi:integrase
MRKKGLTARQVQYMKPDPQRRLEVPAGQPTGLYLVVHPTGNKSWALRYRWKGRPKKLTFETGYPELSLAAARAEAQAALSELQEGIDPAEKALEEKGEPDSCSEVAAEWMKRHVKLNTRTWREVERILNKEVLSRWKDRLISEVGKSDVLRLLDATVDRGAPVLANRILSILKRWFKWCVERGILETSPVTNLRPPAKEKSRDHTMASEELAEVWLAAGQLGFPFGPFFRFLTLTVQRRGEVARIRWEDLDLKAALWTLPAEATKPGRLHDVPLSSTAVGILGALPHFDGPYVFSTTSGRKPISGFSKAKAALDAKILERRQEQDPRAKGQADWRLHDLRRSASTWMAEVGVPPHVLSAILNHSPGSAQGVTAIYNRFRYLEERRQALEAWAENI